MKYKSNRISSMTEKYYVLRDIAEELSRVQEEKNRSLSGKSDYEINVATLNERNRISKEIHDHIGHLLSVSFTVGALLTITKEEIIKEGLTDLKDSISEGMDSIRASIHNMHVDESIDLYASIEKLIKEFTFCPCFLEYDMIALTCLK